MKVLKLKNNEGIPERYTGKAIWDSGTEAYYLDGLFHRIDGPAIIYGNGVYNRAKMWYLNLTFNTYHYQTGKIEDWFKFLTAEQKIIALCNPENF